MDKLSILILCRGNITRSPFIAGYLNHLHRNSDLAYKIHLDIDSSGIEGKTDLPVHPRILEQGFKLGFDMAMYRSKHANLKALERADIILTTDRKQTGRIYRTYPHLKDKTYHYYEFGRVGEFEIIDMDDPSRSDSTISFEEFFETTVPEVNRIYEYIAATYTRSIDEQGEFNSKILRKQISEKRKSVKPYNFLTKRSYPVCPFCQSKRLRRIKRKGILQRHLWPLFNGYPYHCGHCNRNIIMFIGSKIDARFRRERKMQKWKEFLESDTEKNPEMNRAESGSSQNSA